MIQDSGNRKEFDTGAVRDIQQGKGRFDLLPLDIAAEIIGVSPVSVVLTNIYDYIRSGNPMSIVAALRIFARDRYTDNETMLLEISKHFEEGAAKYGERNWEKGISAHCYVNSAVRHYLKYLRGDDDEPHDRAFCWNLMCLLWTVKHIPTTFRLQRRNKSEKCVCLKTESRCFAIISGRRMAWYQDRT